MKRLALSLAEREHLLFALALAHRDRLLAIDADNPDAEGDKCNMESINEFKKLHVKIAASIGKISTLN